MEHLFHPWHWVPVLMALPLVRPVLYYMRQKWRGEADAAAGETHVRKGR